MNARWERIILRKAVGKYLSGRVFLTGLRLAALDFLGRNALDNVGLRSRARLCTHTIIKHIVNVSRVGSSFDIADVEVPVILIALIPTANLSVTIDRCN